MELVIFIGLQASGKSTFFHTYFASTHALVSKDLMSPRNKSKRQARLIESLLQAGRSVVVDNTNPTIEERASIIQLGCIYDAEIIGYYFQSQVKRCLERNQQRSGKAQVPDIAIYATFKKLTCPSYTEGFHKLFYVRMSGNRDFAVREWQQKEPINR